MSVTLKQVAEKSGYSLPTVARIMRGATKSHRPEVCKVVQDVAREIGYRPNRSAATMRTGTFNTFGLLLSSHHWHSGIPENLLAGIQEALNKGGQSLLISQHSEEELSDAGFIPVMLRQRMLDGLIINYHMPPPLYLLEVIEEYKIPSVFINTDIPFNCVRPDDRQAAYDATRRLIELGHTRVAFACDVTKHYSAAHRQAGYESAMRESGLPPRSRAYFENAVVEFQHMLASPDRPTAVLACTGLATLVYLAARETGLSVPDDLSIIGIEQERIHCYPQPFSLAIIPGRSMGALVIDMLKARIAEPPVQKPTVKVPFTFESGATIGKYTGS